MKHYSRPFGTPFSMTQWLHINRDKHFYGICSCFGTKWICSENTMWRKMDTWECFTKVQVITHSGDAVTKWVCVDRGFGQNLVQIKWNLCHFAATVTWNTALTLTCSITSTWRCVLALSALFHSYTDNCCRCSDNISKALPPPQHPPEGAESNFL